MKESDIYFVQKEAIYSHGIYWIGFDYDEGIEVARRLARTDVDDHHDWVLYQYTGFVESDNPFIPHIDKKLLSVNKRDFLRKGLTLVV